MALTIRNLSPEAEKTLDHLKRTKPTLNANTKAIDYVLSDYLKKCEELEAEKINNRELRREIIDNSEDMSAIIKGFKAINKMIAEQE